MDFENFLTEDDADLFVNDLNDFDKSVNELSCHSSSPSIQIAPSTSSSTTPTPICYGCEKRYGFYDIRHFRGKMVCYHCYENDALIRHLMELKQTEDQLLNCTSIHDREEMCKTLSLIAMSSLRPKLIECIKKK